jgi:hypothetical protein
MALAVGLTLTACEKEIMNEKAEDAVVVTDDQGNVLPTKKFSFTLKGDFTSEWKSVNKVQRRVAGYLQADGKDLTDVWVLDYMNGTLVQQIHQSDNTAEDFGKPVMQLAYGNHHVYFIASRGTGADLNTTTHTISFGKILDTFYKDYDVSVVATSNGNRSVTLDRAVTKLKLTFTDAIPSGAATINITPHTWYYGLNYATGEPCAAATDQVFTISIPSTEIGKTGVFTNMYGFSTTTEWTTDIAANSKTSANQVLGSCTIEDAPFKANRVTEYSGPLFNAGGVMELSLNTDWDDPYDGTW